MSQSASFIPVSIARLLGDDAHIIMVDKSSVRPQGLGELADLLIVAKDLADAHEDEQLKHFIREALFRTGRLLAGRTSGERGSETQH